MPRKPDLDLTDLLPSTVMVQAGEMSFEVQTDILPAMQKRISDWMNAYAASLRGVEGAPGADMDTFHAIVADLLDCDIETARLIGFKGGWRLMAFLAKPLNALGRTTTFSEPPSESPSDLMEPSA